MKNSKSMTYENLITLALILSIITIIYNIGEGIVSILFGFTDETLSLFGFGVDSFVEVLSGTGILHMLFRMKKSREEKRDAFERHALRITGIGFFLLTGGLVIGSVITIIVGHKPETTFVGIIISSISIATMWLLMRTKLWAGKKLNSPAIIADAHCTKTCFYLSFILLASSLVYEFFHIPYIDAAGGLGIAIFAFREGKEAFETAKSDKVCSCGSKAKCET